jgi:hypothetical protein
MKLLLSLLVLHSCAATGQALNSSTPPPLFDYETKQLTEDDLASLPAEYQKLFGFDDSAVNSTLFRRSGECKVFPGDEDWPAETVWDKFDEVVNGALIPTVPIGAPCYKNWGMYNEAACAAVEKNFSNPYFQ